MLSERTAKQVPLIRKQFNDRTIFTLKFCEKPTIFVNPDDVIKCKMLPFEAFSMHFNSNRRTFSPLNRWKLAKYFKKQECFPSFCAEIVPKNNKLVPLY